MALEAVDCYSLLGVRPGSDGPSLTEALERRRGALNDRAGVRPSDADAMHSRLGEAYGILLNPARERLYRVYLGHRSDLPTSPDRLADLAIPAELPRTRRGQPLPESLLRPGALEALLAPVGSEPPPMHEEALDATDAQDATDAHDATDATDAHDALDATEEDDAVETLDEPPGSRAPTSPTLRAALEEIPPVREDGDEGPEFDELDAPTPTGPVFHRLPRPPWEGRPARAAATPRRPAVPVPGSSAAPADPRTRSAPWAAAPPVRVPAAAPPASRSTARPPAWPVAPAPPSDRSTVPGRLGPPKPPEVSRIAEDREPSAARAEPASAPEELSTARDDQLEQVPAAETGGVEPATLPPWAGYRPDPEGRSNRMGPRRDRLSSLLPEGRPPGPGPIPDRSELLGEVLLGED